MTDNKNSQVLQLCSGSDVHVGYDVNLTCAFVAVHKAVLQFILFQNFMDFLKEKKRETL